MIMVITSGKKEDDSKSNNHSRNNKNKMLLKPHLASGPQKGLEPEIGCGMVAFTPSTMKPCYKSQCRLFHKGFVLTSAKYDWVLCKAEGWWNWAWPRHPWRARRGKESTAASIWACTRGSTNKQPIWLVNNLFGSVLLWKFNKVLLDLHKPDTYLNGTSMSEHDIPVGSNFLHCWSAVQAKPWLISSSGSHSACAVSKTWYNWAVYKTAVSTLIEIQICFSIAEEDDEGD